MWTYRPSDTVITQRPPQQPAAPVKTPLSVRQQPIQPQRDAPRPAEPADRQVRTGGTTPNVFAQTMRRQRFSAASRPAMLRTACVMGGLYLCGLAVGSVCSRILSEPLMTYARYFASIDLGLRTTGNGAMVFSVGFLSLFCQLTLVLIAGFCVLGVGLIPITMLLKGAGTGVFTALLYQQLGAAKGLLLQALVFWLPEVLGSLFVILLSASAFHVSCGLLRSCLGHGGNGLGTAARRMIRRYLAVNFAAMLVCVLSVLLTLVFGRLF